MFFTKAFAALAGLVTLTSSAALPQAAEWTQFNDSAIIGPFALELQSNDTRYDGSFITGIRIAAASYLGIPTPGPPQSNDYAFYLNTTDGRRFSKPVANDPLAGALGTLIYPILPQQPAAVTMKLQLANGSRINMMFDAGQSEYGWSFDSEGALGSALMSTQWYICTDVETPYGTKTGVVWLYNTGPVDYKQTCTHVLITRKYLQ